MAFSHNLAAQLHLARQFDKAIEESHRTIELDPASAIAHDLLGMSLAAKGMYVHGSLGERSEARRILEQLAAASTQRYTPALAFAAVYVGLDEKDQAFAWLDKAYEERSNRLAYLKNEPVWDRLRPDPRFIYLLRRISLPTSR